MKALESRFAANGKPALSSSFPLFPTFSRKLSFGNPLNSKPGDMPQPTSQDILSATLTPPRPAKMFTP